MRRLCVLLVLLLGCSSDDEGVSTAGSFSDEGVSTAGSFDDGGTPRAGSSSSGSSSAGPFAPASGAPTVFPDLEGAPLREALARDYAGRPLGYGPARDRLFTYEMETDGVLEAVYTGYAVTLPPGDPSAVAADLGINTEHVWPQSRGARAEPLRSDMHHLFPARDVVNASRGALPFGEVDDRRTEAWYWRDRSQANLPASDLDAWSERGRGRFEPREPREGDVARAVFYVAAVYARDVAHESSFFEAMREDLLRWNDLDPPDAAERARSAWIATQQGAENPFVLDPTLARRAFGTRPSRPPPTAGGPRSDADLWLSELHYDNVGEDVDEGVEVAGPPGTPLDGWRIVLYNGNSGAEYQTLALRGPLPRSGAQWIPASLQNGSPDGLALVAPDGSVRQFLSYEGAFTARSGPAQGLRSTEIDATEGPDAAPGRSLSRSSPRAPWRPGPATPGRP